MPYNCVAVVGCGYTGRRLLRSHMGESNRLFALTNQTEVKLKNIESVNINLDESGFGKIPIPENSLIYYLVPPSPFDKPEARVRNFLENGLTHPPKRLVLVSTTGVYGNCNGAWVSEDTPVNPQTDRAYRRQVVEQYCEKYSESFSVSLVVLRVAGIYGVGRLPIERIRNGLVLPSKDAIGYSNRIHVDDLVQVCRASGLASACGVLNVADGHPMLMSDYFNLVAEIWGLPPVEHLTEEAPPIDLSNMFKSYLQESRKIDNRRMLENLKIKLFYPDPRDGLKACLKVESEK